MPVYVCVYGGEGEEGGGRKEGVCAIKGYVCGWCMCKCVVVHVSMCVCMSECGEGGVVVCVCCVCVCMCVHRCDMFPISSITTLIIVKH